MAKYILPIKRLSVSFRIYYNQVIHPELLRLERRRRLMVTSLIGVILLVIAFVVFIISLRLPAAMLFFWMPFVPLFILVNNRLQSYRRLFKPRIVQLILQYIHAQLRYDPDGGITQERFMSSGLFAASPSAYHAEDFVSGTIGNIKFELCELDVRQSAAVEGGPTILFKGLFFCTATPEPFEGRVLIFPNEETQYHIRSIKAITRMGGFRVDMAESSFNDHYSVFADHATDVSNLLSNNLINDIAAYKEKYNKRFFVAFTDGYFYLAVANPRDILEPSLWRSNISFKLINEFYDDLSMITSIVRDFDLDN